MVRWGLAAPVWVLAGIASFVVRAEGGLTPATLMPRRRQPAGFEGVACRRGEDVETGDASAERPPT